LIRALVEVAPRVRDSSGKPVVIVLPVGGDELDKLEAEKGRREIRDTYLEMGVPCYPTLERAARAVAHVARYYEKVAQLR
jgi:acyl-CoA synthetase (NDP forming)